MLKRAQFFCPSHTLSLSQRSLLLTQCPKPNKVQPSASVSACSSTPDEPSHNLTTTPEQVKEQKEEKQKKEDAGDIENQVAAQRDPADEAVRVEVINDGLLDYIPLTFTLMMTSSARRWPTLTR